MRLPNRRERCRTAQFSRSSRPTRQPLSSSGSCSSRQRRLLGGLGAIVTTRDALLTDYFGVGGIGGGCVNAGLLTLAAAFIYWRTGARITGASVAALFLVLGFGLFGKNLLNVWTIVLGVYLLCEIQAGAVRVACQHRVLRRRACARLYRDPVQHGDPVLRSASRSRIATSLAIGFVLPPAAAHLFKAHMGFSLYNMGFTAGIVGTLVVALYKSYGFVPDPVFIWTTGREVSSAQHSFAIVFGSMLVAG